MAWRRAAQYLRMSAEHQRYSLGAQERVIAAWARAHGCEIVRSYVDAGLSGLDLQPRESLKQLLADVLAGNAPFEVVLVFDVSRWGRFQDPDEAAHYEFLCRSCGVDIHYCAEAFPTDGSLVASIMKQIRRAVAADGLRELSAKVVRAQRDVALQGYWRGGAAPYGYRRRMVRFDGQTGVVMQRGEHKALHGHRTRLARGPAREARIVRRIFTDYAVRRLSCVVIARALNAEGAVGPSGRPWKPWSVRTLVANEVYVGTLVLNRRQVRLRKYSAQPASAWIRVPDACPALVPADLFAQAAARRAEYHSGRGFSDEDLRAELREVLRTQGRLDTAAIRATPGTHSIDVIRRRFGSLTAAFEQAGWPLTHRQLSSQGRLQAHHDGRAWAPALSDEELVERLRQLLQRKGRLTSHLIDEEPALPSATTCLTRLGRAAELYARVGYAPEGRQRRIMDAWQARRRKARPFLGPAPPQPK